MAGVLSRVTYALFDHELPDIQGRLGLPEQVLDREIRLEFSDGSTQHVSWTSSPVQYCLGVQAKSWFTPGNGAELDVSQHFPWRQLLGQQVNIEWRDDSERQILEIHSQSASVFLSSREGDQWWADAITVSAKAPSLPSNTSLERTREG